MLVAFSFSSITCFRIVRDDLMASFSVMDLFKKKKPELTGWLDPDGLHDVQPAELLSSLSCNYSADTLW